MGCCGRAEIGDDTNHGCDTYAGEPETDDESCGCEAFDDNECPPPVFGEFDAAEAGFDKGDWFEERAASPSRMAASNREGQAGEDSGIIGLLRMRC